MWLKIAEKTDTKYIGNFLYNIQDKLFHKSAKKKQRKTSYPRPTFRVVIFGKFMQ